MTEMELDLAWLKAATQRWEAKPKPLLEDGTKVCTKSITFPFSLSTYSMYAFWSSDSNLRLASFHTIFGASAADEAAGVAIFSIPPFLCVVYLCCLVLPNTQKPQLSIWWARSMNMINQFSFFFLLFIQADIKKEGIKIRTSGAKVNVLSLSYKLLASYVSSIFVI